MRSPSQSERARSKFLVEPKFSSFTCSRTRKGAVEAKSRMMLAVSSVERSSQTTNSSGVRVCAAMLASCAPRKRAPLYVHIATEKLSAISRKDEGRRMRDEVKAQTPLLHHSSLRP